MPVDKYGHEINVDTERVTVRLGLDATDFIKSLENRTMKVNDCVWSKFETVESLNLDQPVSFPIAEKIIRGFVDRMIAEGVFPKVPYSVQFGMRPFVESDEPIQMMTVNMSETKE